MSTTVRSLRSGVAAFVAGLMVVTHGAAAQQQPLVIDAATGEAMRVEGLSDGAITRLRGGGEVIASTQGGGRMVLRGEIYRPGIWTDPDGCQHWVMDDGSEGYMAPILQRNGMPTCNGGPRDTTEQFVIRKYDVPYTGKYK
ncbi:hypothetical protein [Citreimonas sp.]|uniref:hypothetical protein n=1 Tax=Citreimonas sp. TaxID=3036715 RepID=UPI0035C7C14A